MTREKDRVRIPTVGVKAIIKNVLSASPHDLGVAFGVWGLGVTGAVGRLWTSFVVGVAYQVGDSVDNNLRNEI